MDKYIKADDLLNQAMAEEVEVQILGGNEQVIGEGNAITINDLMKLVNKMPSVDVAEVVRCKDCKFYGRFITGICDDHDCGVGDDDFCSYGKRRETE